MFKRKTFNAARLAALCAGLACCTAGAAELTVISFGGANKDAQVKAFYQPYEAATGEKIIAGEYNGEMARIKAMVDTGNITWDLVEVEMPELTRGCDEGMFEEIDPKLFNEQDYVPGAVNPCGVGFFVWSTVLAYNADKVSRPPASWADFWDVKTFPGKRGLRKGAKYTLEFALMADGVAPADVYKVLATREGQDRAFKKLDQIKPYIQWWEAGAQPPQYLAAGDVVMSSAYNGRIAAVRDSSNLKLVWNGGIYDFDAWAIPKGSKKIDQTLKFMQFTLAPEAQRDYARNIAYGPASRKAVSMLPAEVAQTLPTAAQNIGNQVRMDVGFWADYGESLEQRFNAWAAR